MIDAQAQHDSKTSVKYVFVCGLERSGTTLLASNLARLENCTGFNDTGVMKDEGQYLQHVYRSDPEFGGAGRYGFDPRAHLTEASDLLTPANVISLRESWHAHWESGKSICLEKTPGNLIRTRFLQAAFPNSYFVVITRHPVPVSLATQKWSVTPLHRLFRHWLRCYGLFEQDKKHLKNLYELTYEDYINNPARHHQDIAAFIGTCARTDLMEEVDAAHNRRYFDRWVAMLSDSPWKSYYRCIAGTYESSFANYGYSLIDGCGLGEEMFRNVGKAASGRGALCCVVADFIMFPWRIGRKALWSLERQLRVHLPQSTMAFIRRLLGKAPTRGPVSAGEDRGNRDSARTRSSEHPHARFKNGRARRSSGPPIT